MKLLATGAASERFRGSLFEGKDSTPTADESGSTCVDPGAKLGFEEPVHAFPTLGGLTIDEERGELDRLCRASAKSLNVRFLGLFAAPAPRLLALTTGGTKRGLERVAGDLGRLVQSPRILPARLVLRDR
jgi:hypothetical protein